MRVFEPDAPPAYPHRSWPRTRGVSHPLEVASGSPNHRAGLFGAAFDDGKADRSWSQTAGSRRVASRSGRSTPKAAWPQTAIGSRGVACARPPEANTESPLASTLSLLSFIRYTERVPCAGAKGGERWLAGQPMYSTALRVLPGFILWMILFIR